MCNRGSVPQRWLPAALGRWYHTLLQQTPQSASDAGLEAVVAPFVVRASFPLESYLQHMLLCVPGEQLVAQQTRQAQDHHVHVARQYTQDCGSHPPTRP